MEAQLKEQGAADRLDEVLAEIPRVRADLGYIPLVTPTSQIVGTQAVLNVLAGERYKTITKETAAILKGEYGAAPAPLNAQLQARVLQGSEAITCRPADLLPPEWERLGAELLQEAQKAGIEAASLNEDDRLTYALFPQVAFKFFHHRGDPSFFEPIPGCVAKPEPQVVPGHGAQSSVAGATTRYDVRVDGVLYCVEVAPSGALASVQAMPVDRVPTQKPAIAVTETLFPAPLAGTIVKLIAEPGQRLEEGAVLLVMEAMKMEAEIRVPCAGILHHYYVQPGDLIAQGATLAGFMPLESTRC